ncbi:carbohydrate-binding module family 14 protein [Nocardia colli]|uniref:carbohydrate-binding module family 14 protein n=1 Tax=Nocardia colli TaxID=2545717 RepID=UPI0035D87DDA
MAQAVGSCPEGREHGDLWPDEDDRGKFYQCSWGTAYAFECPPGMHFNDQVGVCDDPQPS